jgi:hypothetical protein
MFVYCECCVLSGRGLCDGSNPCPQETYQELRVILKPRQWGGLGTSRAVAPQIKKKLLYQYSGYAAQCMRSINILTASGYFTYHKVQH